jgi:hypothetical protein
LRQGARTLVFDRLAAVKHVRFLAVFVHWSICWSNWLCRVQWSGYIMDNSLIERNLGYHEDMLWGCHGDIVCCVMLGSPCKILGIHNIWNTVGIYTNYTSFWDVSENRIYIYNDYYYCCYYVFHQTNIKHQFKWYVQWFSNMFFQHNFGSGTSVANGPAGWYTAKLLVKWKGSTFTGCHKW